MKQFNFGAIAAVVVIAAAGVYFAREGLQQDVVADRAHSETMVPSPMNAFSPKDTQQPTVMPTSSLPSAPEIISKFAEFERLAKSGKPSDAYRAWSLAAGCEAAVQWKAVLQAQPNAMDTRQATDKLPSREAACGDLSPGQIASRVQYIVTASRAGVHGAAMNLISFEGPDGLLHTYSRDDPEWMQLEHDAVQASLATADPGTLLMRATGKTCQEEDISKCKPDPSALRDYVASQTSQAIDEGHPPPKFDPNKYAKSLSLEVAQKAIAEGQMIVATRRQP